MASNYPPGETGAPRYEGEADATCADCGAVVSVRLMRELGMGYIEPEECPGCHGELVVGDDD